MEASVRLDLRTPTGAFQCGALAPCPVDGRPIEGRIVAVDGNVELLSVGLELDGVFTQPGDASYGFATQVVAFDPRTGQVRCSPPQRIHRMQRRVCLRVPIDLRIELAVAGPRRRSEPGHSGWLTATTFDLGIAGIGVVAHQVLGVDQIVLCRLALPLHDGDDVLEIRARVTRIGLEPGDPDAAPVFNYGLEFMDLAEHAERRLQAAFERLTASS